MGKEFDEELKARLIAFQLAHGLTGDGVADAETWRTLVGAGSADSEVTQTRQGQTRQGQAGQGQTGQGQAKLKPGVCNHPHAACPDADNLSAKEVVLLALHAGFLGKNLAIAVAVAKAESGWDRCCFSSTGDVGLWQINQRHWKKYGGRDNLYDAATNAAAAFDLFSKGKFGHWNSFNDGKHEQYMPEAEEAVLKVLADK